MFLPSAHRRFSFDFRVPVALLLACLITVPDAVWAQAQGLNIEIVEGDGAINNVRLRTAREAIVEVQDENHKPVSGALVLLSTRGSNPFTRSVLQATTDATGRVRANPLELRSKPGRFEIHVKATYNGHTANAVIHQTNALQGGAQPGSTVSTAGVVATPAAAGITLVTVLVIAGLAAGGLVGGLFGAGVIGGGGRSAQVSVGTPHF